MIHTTSDYKEKIKKNRVFYCQANIQLSDGTSFDVGNEDIMSDGWGYEEGVSDTNSFCIGAAVINQFELSLRNDDGHLNAYDFDGAVIRPKIGLRISDDTIETLPRGVYHSDPGNTQGATIRLTALDNMSLFEAPYSDVGTVFPATLGTIVRDICQAKGVTLATQDFDRSDYVVQDRPDDEDMTCLAMISYSAQLAGCYAKCNTDGELEMKWYKDVFSDAAFENPSEDELDEVATAGEYHHFKSLSSLNACTEDVVITGISVADASGNEFLYGSEGYILSIEDNPLILDGQAETVAIHLGNKIIGMRFRPLNASALSDPSVEAGDPAILTDRKGSSYACYLTNVSFSIGNYMQMSCDAETPSKNRSKQYSAATKTIVAARKAAEIVVSAYDQQVKNVTSLISAGNGLYQTDVLQEDGSTITYLHDKLTVEESEYVYCRTSSGIMVSRDGGATWAVDKNGNALFNTIAAHGMSMDWLNAGSIKVADEKGNLRFYVNIDTNEVYLNGEFVKIEGSSIREAIDQAVIQDEEEPEETTRMWLDTSQTPPLLKQWNGEEWVVVGKDYSDEIATVNQKVDTSIQKTQDAILTTVSEQYYRKGAEDDPISVIESRLQQDAYGWTASIDSLKTDVDHVGETAGNADKKVTEISNYLRYVVDENGVGTVELGTSESPVVLKQRHNRVYFEANGKDVMYIEVADDLSSRLYITDGEFLGQLKIGNLAFMRHVVDNGIVVKKVVG